MLVDKFSLHLEKRDINHKTGLIWKIDDVPSTWRDSTREKVLSDGYYFDEDGTAHELLKEDEETTEEAE